jgi:hypothetical protein
MPIPARSYNAVPLSGRRHPHRARESQAVAASQERPSETDGAAVAEEPERWVTWDVWIEEQAKRIFAEGRKKSYTEPIQDQTGNSSKTTPFRHSFFAQISEIHAVNRSEFIEQAKRQGTPEEAAVAYWSSQEPLKKRPGG